MLQISDEAIGIRRLYGMLEGQVAVLSSGALSPAEACEVLAALRASPIYREDQHSYMLYPDRTLASFFEKNTISAEQVERSALLGRLLAEKDVRLVERDVSGAVHFNPDFRNGRDVERVLDELRSEGLEALVDREAEVVAEIFESIFDHERFTGRSGTFYGYEGLGSIYWHMVSKLLLAVQESALEAAAANDTELFRELAERYYDVRSGLGFNKAPGPASGNPVLRSALPFLAALLCGPLAGGCGSTPAPVNPDGQAVTLRVVAYNIKHGRGMDGEVDLDRVADVLRALDADVITLQEVDDRTERTFGVDQTAAIASRLGYRGFHGPHRPYQGGFYGNAVLTRLPVRASRTHPIPSPSGSALAVHEVEVELDGVGGVSVVSVHLAGSPEERLAQADSLTRLFAEKGHPVLLAGDFNGRPAGPVVERLADSWRVLTKWGDPNTYPADGPDREIDFVMVGGGGGRAGRSAPPPFLQAIEHRVVPEAMASDHRPILAVLRVRAR